MLLDNSLDDFCRGRAIPGSLGINHRDGTLLADAQAIRLGAVNTVAAGQQVQLRQSAFQILPRFETHFFRRAFGLGLVAAQEDVAADVADLQALGDLYEALDFHASIVARMRNSGAMRFAELPSAIRADIPKLLCWISPMCIFRKGGAARTRGLK